ncbi:ATP-binding protein [Pyrococcus horikoshii]|nr:ATP-binding protein [Pyrococcus horikoshii]HII61301.1 ATP-binding protein [Pyrococcus horikoshii]
MLRKENFLYAEAEFLLRQELREPARYFAILRAISLRKTTHGEIVDYTGFDRGIVSKYLDNLARIRVIRKVHPAFEPEKKEEHAVRDCRQLLRLLVPLRLSQQETS